jgi:hypothetical protein
MIIKGKSRGNGAQLGQYVITPLENERVEVFEIHGVAATNVPDAVIEMDALAAGTRCENPLYHASINTRAKERMTDEQRRRAIERLAEELGFSGQPYVAVIHEKKGREHCHVVWARIDIEKMRAISDSNNYLKHEIVARELEREFGHERVQGAHAEREGKPRPKRTPSHAEMQQAERTGLTPQQVTEQVTALWRSADNGQSFAAALSDAGYVLARGDRRDFVIIDPKCGTHSLARRIEGARVRDVRERMADLDPSELPSVAQAKAIQRARQIERGEGVSYEASPAATRDTGRKAPKADHGRSHGTHEKPGAEARALDGATKGISSIFDGIASIFERGLSGDESQIEPEPPAPEPGPREPEVEPSVLADEEQKTKRRQELAREFGRDLEDERDAESERERRRSR